MNTILIVENKFAVSKMLSMNLVAAGYRTILFCSGEEVLTYLRQGGQADLAFVDVMLSKTDGTLLVKSLLQTNILTIYLTANRDIADKSQGLSDSEENCIVLPLDIPQLLAQIKKILKHRGTLETILKVEEIAADTEAKEVTRQGRPVFMTPMEFELLVLFMKHPRTVFSRDYLMTQIWGRTYGGNTRVIDVCVSQLRRKTGLHLISVPKIGYRLEEDG